MTTDTEKDLGFELVSSRLSVYLINGFMKLYLLSIEVANKANNENYWLTALLPLYISVSQSIHVADLKQHKPLRC